MALQSGTQLGAYRIVGPLGTGGMGEVYLAQDTRLDRKVALKLLPAEVASNQDRMRRFILEAKAAASLNHPNIAHVYEIGEADGQHFIAMEFVDGLTLREKIHRERTELRKLLKYLQQVAEGLSKAHAAGIVHRDLKPDNIMIARDGYAKILDFGLAKLIEPQSPKGSESNASGETATAILAQHSTPGMVMGTVGYMSPEQAQGKIREIDHRSDIFSFGCILYEAATRQKAFEGKDLLDSLHKIVHAPTPQIKDFNAAAPVELQRIVRRCLAKDPEERYQTIKDVAIELKELRREIEDAPEVHRTNPPSSSAVAQVSTEGEPTGINTIAKSTAPTAEVSAAASTQTSSSAEYLVGSIKRHKTRAFLILSLLAIATLAAAFGVYKFLNKNESRPATSSQMKVMRLTSTGKVKRATISPDGKYAVHVVDDAGQQGLWIRQIATASNVNVLPPAEADYLGLTFSQDGNYVYYVRREKVGGKGTIYQMPTLGGSSRKIMEGADGAITLSPDGKRFAFMRNDFNQGESALIVANVDGSGERKLATRKEPEGFETEGLAWSPNGKVIACSGYFVSGDDAVGLIEVAVEDGREKRILPQKWGSIRSVAWLGDGSGLLMSAADKSSGYFYQIWYVAYASGEARRITNDLNSYSDVSLRADSNTLLTVQGDAISNLWIAPNGDSSRAQRITSGKHDGNMGVAWTPDGKIVHASRDWDISILDADGSNQKLLTIDEHNNRWVSVTPDGRYILFESWRKSASATAIWRMDIDGGNPKPLTGQGWASDPKGSPDGRWVVYELNASGKTTLWKTSIDGGEAKQLTDKVTEDPAISPDGKLIACFYYPDRQNVKIAVIPFEGGEPVFEFDVDQSIRDKTPGWTADGRAVTYVLNRGGVSNIWSQPLDGGKPVQLTDFKMDRIFAYDWSRDGKQLVLARGTISNDVVLISDFR
ncbi:MAG: protein kinase [Acidobacteriota bacterium]